jgi:hypothetical protein
MVNKGERIIILWGKHHGKKAWLNADKQESKSKYPIVYKFNDEYYKTSVYKHMVAIGQESGQATTLEQAAFEQIPELEQAINTLTTKLAMCGILQASPELLQKIGARLNHAVERQQAKGSKALWLNVNWKA